MEIGSSRKMADVRRLWRRIIDDNNFTAITYNVISLRRKKGSVVVSNQ